MTENIKKVIQDLVTALLSSKSTIRAVAVEQFGISGEFAEGVITTTQVRKRQEWTRQVLNLPGFSEFYNCWFQNKGGEIKLDIYSWKR